MVEYPWSRARGLLGNTMEERTWRKGEFWEDIFYVHILGEWTFPPFVDTGVQPAGGGEGSISAYLAPRHSRNMANIPNQNKFCTKLGRYFLSVANVRSGCIAGSDICRRVSMMQRSGGWRDEHDDVHAVNDSSDSLSSRFLVNATLWLSADRQDNLIITLGQLKNLTAGALARYNANQGRI